MLKNPYNVSSKPGFDDELKIFNKKLIGKVFRISLPMIITELINSIFSITDTYFVKGLGTSALAGVGLGGYFFWLFSVVLVVFNGGLMIYVAQAYGAREFEKARRGLGETLLYSCFISILLGIIGYYIGLPVLVLLNGEYNETAYLAYLYFRVRSIGLPLMAVSWGLNSSLIAIGETKKSMYANVASVLVNIVLDPIMIYGYFGFPALGVEGAAWATLVSTAILLVITYYYIVSLGLSPMFSIKPFILYRILSLGVPMGIERAIFTLGNNIYIAIIARCGDIALAAHNIGIRIESLIYMPGFAFAMAASALVGQYVGANQLDKAKSIGLEAIKASLLLMTILGLAIALTSSYITSPFIPSGENGDEVHVLASIYLVLAGLSEPGLALAMTASGGIRGAGNTRLPVLVNVTSFYLSRILPAIILVQYLGVIGAWIAMFIDVYVRGLVLLIVYVKMFYRLVHKVV